MSRYHQGRVLCHLAVTIYNVKLRCFCFDLDPNEFGFFHISVGFNGTDVVPNQSDYPTLGSSTAITSEGLVTSTLILSDEILGCNRC